MKTTTYESVVSKVTEALEDGGDMFFSTGNRKEDYQIIKGTLEQQGYWSGTRLRYYFDENYELTSIEEK